MVQTAHARRRGDEASRRREILAAASEVFRRSGFHGAGMREIAARLGVAVGKLYYWFRSKDEILAFCQRACLEALLRNARSVGAPGLPADARLWLLLVGHLRCLHEEFPGSLAHLEVESLPAAERGPVLRLRRQYEEAVRTLVREGIGTGRFVAVNEKVAAFGLLGAVNWSVKWFRPDGALPLRVVAPALADQLVRGLLRDPASFVRPEIAPEPVGEEDGDAGS